MAPPEPSNRAGRPRTVIGPTIRQLRKARDLTLTDLAAQSCISVSHLSVVERGIQQPSFVVAGRIAQALGVAPSDLLTPPPLTASNDALAAALTGAGMDAEVAWRIQRNVSAHLRRSILQAMSAPACDGDDNDH